MQRAAKMKAKRCPFMLLVPCEFSAGIWVVVVMVVDGFTNYAEKKPHIMFVPT